MSDILCEHKWAPVVEWWDKDRFRYFKHCYRCTTTWRNEEEPEPRVVIARIA